MAGLYNTQRGQHSAPLVEAPGKWIGETDVTQLEQWIDAMQTVVPKQHAFVLPAGGEAVCRCHICRTICRRAERKMIASEAPQTAYFMG